MRHSSRSHSMRLALHSRRSAIAVLCVVGWLAGIAPATSNALSSLAGTNVAPSASYTLAPKPNADYAPEKTGRELTDGIRSFGRFWSNGQSVGWEKRSPVVYRQTYQAEIAVKSVEIGTGKNARSMIALPSHAFVYVAGNDGRFALVGDVRQTWQPDASVADGTLTLAINFEPVIARHIEIIFFRDSPFLFLDEVRILSAASGRYVDGSLTRDQVTEDAVSRRRSEAEKRAGQGPIGPSQAGRFAWTIPHSSPPSATQECLAVRISPWTEGTAQEIFSAPSLMEAPSLHSKEGWLIAAFRVENRKGVEQSVRLDFDAGSGTGTPHSSAVSFVLGLDYKWRADVVQRTDSIMVPPNSFAFLLVEAPISGIGDIHLGTTVVCGSTKINFEITGRSIPVEEQDRPHGNLWSYLTGPVARTASCWPDFHSEVGVDTAVVNETALNRRINKNAETLLRTYIRTFSKTRRLLLYMEMTDPSWPQGEDERTLEAELTEWWNWASGILQQESYKGEVALYPIDEVKPGQVRRLNVIANIFRRVAPGVPLYGTIDNTSALASADVDIVQVLDRILPSLSPQFVRQREVQVYSTKPLGKTLSLSSHYRRLSWLAFSVSLRGSGFWSMWDASGTSSPQLGWSDFGGAERDYAAVYGSPTGCIYPSRRLLAWRRGLEDLAVMNACSRRSGEDMRPKVQTFVQREEQDATKYDETLSSLVLNCAE